MSSRLPMVQRDIKRFSASSHIESLPLPADRRFGRLAKSDEVASCLLRREYADALPLRHESLVARNRRRLKVVFVLVLLWWAAGWLCY